MIGSNEAQLLAYWIYKMDHACRTDLMNGIIANERDYVSTLCTRIRDHLRAFHIITNDIHAKTLNGKKERLFGCDSIMVFRLGNEVKVGLFEAKWPRFFKKPAYPWDKGPRFSSQIIRQRNWVSSGVVIWEMFFNEAKPGKVHAGWDSEGSNCILHTYADNYLINHKSNSSSSKWNNVDLSRLFGQNLENIYDIAFYMLTCRYGEKIAVEGYSFKLTSKSDNSEQTFRVPIPVTEGSEIVDAEAVTEFMGPVGLENYIYVDLDEIKRFIGTRLILKK